MFELVLIVCTLAAGEPQCSTSVSAETSERAACERVGNITAHMIAARLPVGGYVAWGCRERGEAV